MSEAVGILLQFIATFLAASSYVLQKRAHLHTDKRKLITRWEFLLAIVLLIITALLDALALTMLSQVQVAPFAAVTLAFNTLLCIFVLREKFTVLILLSCVLISIGTILSLMGTSSTSKLHDFDDFVELLKRPIVIYYAISVVSFLVICGLFVLYRTHVVGTKQWHSFERQALFLLIPTLAGFFMGFTGYAGKVVGTVIFSKDWHTMESGLFYVFVLLGGLSAFFQVYFLNLSLEVYPAISVIPVFECVIILSNIMAGMFLLNEKLSNILLFVLGTIICSVGVLVLLKRKETDEASSLTKNSRGSTNTSESSTDSSPFRQTGSTQKEVMSNDRASLLSSPSSNLLRQTSDASAVIISSNRTGAVPMGGRSTAFVVNDENGAIASPTARHLKHRSGVGSRDLSSSVSSISSRLSSLNSGSVPNRTSSVDNTSYYPHEGGSDDVNMSIHAEDADSLLPDEKKSEDSLGIYEFDASKKRLSAKSITAPAGIGLLPSGTNSNDPYFINSIAFKDNSAVEGMGQMLPGQENDIAHTLVVSDLNSSNMFSDDSCDENDGSTLISSALRRDAASRTQKIERRKLSNADKHKRVNVSLSNIGKPSISLNNSTYSVTFGNNSSSGSNRQSSSASEEWYERSVVDVTKDLWSKLTGRKKV